MKRRVSRSSSAWRERARLAADAALRAAVRQPQERALPRHPHRERGALAERDVRVVADAALRRAEHARVLHPVAGEDAAGCRRRAGPGRSTIERALRVAEPLGDLGRDVGVRERLLELGQRLPVERRVPLERSARRVRRRAGHAAESTFGRSDPLRPLRICESRTPTSRKRSLYGGAIGIARTVGRALDRDRDVDVTAFRDADLECQLARLRRAERERLRPDRNRGEAPPRRVRSP